MCAYLTEEESECKVAQRHQECLIKFWNSLWVLVFLMALKLKGRISRDRPAATARSLLQNGKISQKRQKKERDREQREWRDS